MKIVLASGSPRRRALFSELGWDFVVEKALIDEVKIEGERPADMVCRLAEAKASEVFSRLGANWTVGADTTVVIGREVLGKPRGETEAVKMLSALQGRTHSVLTGVAVIAPDGRRLISYEKTDVTFRPLSSDEVTAYVAKGESPDKAGAYAIQGFGMLLVEKIDGCYFNVVGLPLTRLSKMFSELGWPLAEQWRSEL
jgi:septum formation protein